MTLASPSVHATGATTTDLPGRYTCDGPNTSPALRWKGTPADTAELALFAINLQPVDGKLFRKAVLDTSGNAGILAVSYGRG